MPDSTSAGVLGMARTMRLWPPSQRARSPTRTPAAMVTTSALPTSGARPRATSRSCWGLTASTMQSAPSTAAVASACAATPSSRVTRLRACGSISTTRIASGDQPFRMSPPISAVAMLPPPTNAMRIKMSCRAAKSGLKVRCPRARTAGAAAYPYIRCPNMAVPTLTSVAPSAMAASKSSDMPIESVSSA
jgi:hypothetical protein